MRLLSLDCEYNQPSQKTIEIGAVIFEPIGREVKKGIIHEPFHRFVNPNEPINPDITSLTGITDLYVSGATDIKTAVQALSDFKKNNDINPIAVVWGAGTSNDVRHIYQEAKLENPFNVRIIDVKAIYNVLANASTQEMRAKMGLAKACDTVGIGWDDYYGQPHRALADAYNTMRLYVYFSKILTNGHNLIKSTRNK